MSFGLVRLKQEFTLLGGAVLVNPCPMESDGTLFPRAQDVIMGRGKGPETHAGNVAFLREIAKYVKEYYETKSRKVKKQITWNIVTESHSKGIRFLCRINADEWREADEEAVRVRVGQSLRYLYRQQEDSGKPKPDRKGNERTLTEPEKKRQKTHIVLSPTDPTDPPHDDFLRAIHHLPAEVLDLNMPNSIHEDDDVIDFSGDFTTI